MSRQYHDDTAVDDADLDEFDDEPGESTTWRWVAAVAAVVLVGAVVGTVTILRGGDSSTVSGRVVPSASQPAAPQPSTTRTAPRATVAQPSTAASTSLPPEIPTVVSPTPSASPTPADSRTVVYTVSGTRSAADVVTVTYTDETGVLRTDLNVSLPWSKTVVRSGDVLINSVTAISFHSELNCTITDASGTVLVSQDGNTIATTCNR